jgi:hypothetical protein
MLKKISLAVIMLSSLLLIGCGGHYEKEKRIKTVKYVDLVQDQQNKVKTIKGISMSLNAIIGKEAAKYPQLQRSLPWSYNYTHCYNAYNWYTKRSYRTCENRVKSGEIANKALFPLPAFEVEITNNTDHVLKFNNSVMVLEDSSGNIFDVMDKSSSQVFIKESMRRSLKDTVPANKIEDAMNMSGKYADQMTVRLLDKNFKVLPGKSRKGFLTFNYGKYSEEEFKEFVMNQRKLNVQLYEIPVDVNRAGEVLETAAFSFDFDVKVTTEKVPYYVNVWVADKD